MDPHAHGTASVIGAERPSLVKEVLHWLGLRFAGYLLVMAASGLAFFVWATVYTYVWPGKPPATRLVGSEDFANAEDVHVDLSINAE